VVERILDDNALILCRNYHSTADANRQSHTPT
jgi:hypothetical protein